MSPMVLKRSSISWTEGASRFPGSGSAAGMMCQLGQERSISITLSLVHLDRSQVELEKKRTWGSSVMKTGAESYLEELKEPSLSFSPMVYMLSEYSAAALEMSKMAMEETLFLKQ